ncbi:DUF3450 domain-containing protein [Thaumasiovibrio subtropicus]|uniref:DUF3450 domain-containing protein n=1 Tax=Thaumasiovibrio subtropicus TaxID=1891207 RepID=UPI000B34B4CE|nr:DUF3450 domain-containing protein [Thaumasiovibrio subtropicus]
MTLNKRLLLVAMLGLTSATSYASLDGARGIESRSQKDAVAAQGKVNTSAENTIQYRAEIEQLKKEIENLSVYREHLTALTDNQAQEMVNLELQIEEIKDTRQGVVPLMYNMLAGLKTLVENDRPIRATQRQERIAKLDTMMTDANVADAEKFRRILEAWQIEMDYGTKIGTYQAAVDIDGQTRQVDVLYLGRISLVARSLDNSHYWAWNDQSRQWQSVDITVGQGIDQAFALASRQIAPTMLTLPVSAKETEK